MAEKKTTDDKEKELKDSVEKEAEDKAAENTEVKEENTDKTVNNAESDSAKNEAEATENEADNSDGEPEDGKESDDGKKGLFKKKPKKDKKDEMIEELNDKYKRLFAEFDNFRKRSEAEKASNYEFGARDVILKVLPIVDNFERGLDAVPEDEKGSPFAEGMEMIYKQLMTALDDLGVKPIEAVGAEFDPELHNAVMQTELEEFGENIVSQEMQKGYMYKEKAIRHSMVAVNK